MTENTIPTDDLQAQSSKTAKFASIQLHGVDILTDGYEDIRTYARRTEYRGPSPVTGNTLKTLNIDVGGSLQTPTQDTEIIDEKPC
jgi:hypothetical protein